MHEFDGRLGLAVVYVLVLHETEAVLGTDTTTVFGRELVYEWLYGLLHFVREFWTGHVEMEVA